MRTLAHLFGLLLVLLNFPQETFECATNGVCGGSPYCNQPPAQPRSCSCQSCYGCGNYGCYKMRARAANTFRSRSRSRISMDRRFDSKHPSASRLEQLAEEARQEELGSHRVAKPVSPNRAFYECCLDRQLPDACLQKCSFGSYHKQALTAMYFNQDACPLAAMRELQYCAAQGRDHRACCARNGVTTTLAGVKCLTFCDQTPGRITQLDLSYVPCFDRFEEMKACFWSDVTNFWRQ